MTFEKCIGIFGGSHLQLPIIRRCKELNIKTIVLDPDPNALAQNDADVFAVIDGDDFEGTYQLLKDHHADGIITSSTDKPLVMMSRVSEALKLPFFSVDTAVNCTDKFKMKQVFLDNQIPCAKGHLITQVEDISHFPAIIKPLDNSGSRGVYYCENRADATAFFKRTQSFSKKKEILCEQYLEGKEYSIESIHYKNQHQIIQITEKLVSAHPYNVELGHIAPSNLSEAIKNEIEVLLTHLSTAFNFKNCAAHTEIKIHNGKIHVIETSPRLGGDFITSKLVPISTGISIEDELIKLCMGLNIEFTVIDLATAGIFYLNLEQGVIDQIDNLQSIKKIPGVMAFEFDLKEGDSVPSISNSLERYGYLILKGTSRKEILELKERLFLMLNNLITVNRHA